MSRCPDRVIQPMSDQEKLIQDNIITAAARHEAAWKHWRNKDRENRVFTPDERIRIHGERDEAEALLFRSVDAFLSTLKGPTAILAALENPTLSAAIWLRRAHARALVLDYGRAPHSEEQANAYYAAVSEYIDSHDLFSVIVQTSQRSHVAESLSKNQSRR